MEPPPDPTRPHRRIAKAHHPHRRQPTVPCFSYPPSFRGSFFQRPVFDFKWGVPLSSLPNHEIVQDTVAIKVEADKDSALADSHGGFYPVNVKVSKTAPMTMIIMEPCSIPMDGLKMVCKRPGTVAGSVFIENISPSSEPGAAVRIWL